MIQFDDAIGTNRMAELRQNEEENLIKSLANQYGYPYVDLRGVTINPNALLVIPEATARAAKLISFELMRKKLSVAIRNPNDPSTKQVLTNLDDAGYKLNIFMTPTVSLEHGWKRYNDQKNTQAVKHGVLDIDAARIAEQSLSFKNKEAVAAYLLDIKTINNARRVSETLESTFAGAIALHASDIHIEPEEYAIRLRFRLDGVLHDITDLDHTLYDRLMSRLKLLSGMTLNIKTEAQDGRFTFTAGEKQVEVRSSIIPGANGESIVMRLLDPTVASFNMESLGLNQILHNVMLEELKRPNGMVITTGPTGSGKTTALYAFLRHTHREGVKIITIEDPVEYKLDDIVQTQVEDNYTFSTGLRAVLRQDPDIIMIGEIRDREVAETAVHAAQTGHLVFSTLHTNSAVGALPRLIDLGVDYRIIGSSINIILGQRLVRVLCPHCKQDYKASASERDVIMKILATHPAAPTITQPLTLYKPVGCSQCSESGFKGRQGVYEAIKMDNPVEQAVMSDPREHIILEAAKSQGIPTMAEDGVEKILAGLTSLAELERVVDLSTGRHTLTDTTPSTDEDDFGRHII